MDTNSSPPARARDHYLFQHPRMGRQRAHWNENGSMQPHWAPRTAGPYCMQHVFNFFFQHRLFLTVARSSDSRIMSACAWQLSSAHDGSCADACAVVQQYYCATCQLAFSRRSTDIHMQEPQKLLCIIFLLY
jgi:hypothetical protein